MLCMASSWRTKPPTKPITIAEGRAGRTGSATPDEEWDELEVALGPSSGALVAAGTIIQANATDARKRIAVWALRIKYNRLTLNEMMLEKLWLRKKGREKWRRDIGF